MKKGVQRQEEKSVSIFFLTVTMKADRNQTLQTGRDKLLSSRRMLKRFDRT